MIASNTRLPSPTGSDNRPTKDGDHAIGNPASALGKHIILVVPHASNALPLWLNGFESDPVWMRVRPQHWAFDRGVEELAQDLAMRLGTNPVLGDVSRLAMDLNRDLANRSVIPDSIPGIGRLGFNSAATAPDLSARWLMHACFHGRIEEQVRLAISTGLPAFLIDLHTFDRFGPTESRREVDIGVCAPGVAGFALDLFHFLQACADERPASEPPDPVAGTVNVRFNEPYTADHPGAYVTRRHSSPDVHGVVIEVCDELLVSSGDVRAVGELLFLAIAEAAGRVDCALASAT
jgi:predicted N-formylglutamate amidohydrolase